MQADLIGEVKHNLRAVQVDFNKEKKEVHAWFYFDGEISDADRDLASYLFGQATNDCDSDFRGSDHVERLDYPQEIPLRGYYAYLRDESFLPQGTVVTNFGKNKNEVILKRHLNERAYLLLRVQDALLGHIQPHLREVQTSLNEWKKILYFWFYYDKPLSSPYTDAIKQVIQKSASHFDSKYNVEETISKLEYPASTPQIGIPVYQRNRNTFISRNENDVPRENRYDLGYLLKRTQEGLLGKVTPHLRAVKVGIDQHKEIWYSWFYYDRGIKNEEKQLASEALRYYPFGYTKEEYLERLDHPAPIPHIGRYAYLRYEPSTSYQESQFEKLQSSLLNHLNGLEKEPNLRAVKADINEADKTIYFWFYFLEGTSEQNLKCVRKVIQETAAYFESEYSIEDCIEELPFSKKIPDVGWQIFPKEEKEVDITHELIDWGEWSRPTYSLLLHVQKELLGKVRPHLRAVKSALDDSKKLWYIWFYFDGEVQDIDYELSHRVVESISAFLHYRAIEYIERLDFPHKIPLIGDYAYLRHEK